MTDPTTTNTLFAVPTRGSDPGTWDVPVNANSTALDGYIGGVVTVSLSNAPVTLTAPTGVPTPGAGPFQSQNRILKFTGTLTSNVAVTLPLPGEYTIQNLTTGNFIVTFNAASAGNIVSTPQGSIMHVFCDGSNVWLVKNQIPGALTFMGGVSAIPAWIAGCTIPPYLLCDGTIYNTSVYPALGTLYGSNFGGNGTTTFGVEDLRGRVPLAYDGTGTRITVAGSGINGQVLGASADNQSVTLTTAQMPAHNHAITDPGHNHTVNQNSNVGNGSTPAASSSFGGEPPANTSVSVTGISIQNTGGGALHTNVQPSQVAGIWLVST